MASKSTLYRPVQLTCPVGSGTCVSINPTTITNASPATSNENCTETWLDLKDRNRPGVLVKGTVKQVTLAWATALAGGPLTEVEWGYQVEP